MCSLKKWVYIHNAHWRKFFAHDFVANLLDELYVARMVKMDTTDSSNPEPLGSRERLTALREALLYLHKALLESERVSYEASFGQISSPYHFLHLATNDPWFAWLSPVTQLIATVDETLDAKEPLTAAGVESLFKQAGTLLVATADGEGFSRHYDEALQRSPDVILAHAAAAKVIRSKN